MMDMQQFAAICILLCIAAASADDAARSDGTTLNIPQTGAIEPSNYHFSGGGVGARCYIWQRPPRTFNKYYCKSGLVCCPNKPPPFMKRHAQYGWYTLGVCSTQCATVPSSPSPSPSPSPRPTCGAGTSPKPGAEVLVKLYGVAYNASMEAGVVAAAVKALGIPDNHTYNLGCVQVQLVARGNGSRISSRTATLSLPRNPASSVTGEEVHAAALSELSSIIKLLFYAAEDTTDSFLQSATASTGPFMAFLRNALPTELFPASGGGVQQCADTKVCDGPTFVVIQPISTCNVDVCFLIDGSGSIKDEGWQVEINVVDSIIGAIGDPHAIVAAVEFSQSRTTLIPPTKKGEVDASTLRKVTKEDGGTDMAGGISACQSLFEQEPMRSTGRKKIMVLLTDGKPDSKAAATAAADKAKTAGITIVTMGVAGADLNLMTSLSSGLGYNFSADFFNNDAANIGAEIAPQVCSSNQGPAEHDLECRQLAAKTEDHYPKPEPCWKSDPIPGIAPIKACGNFQYVVGKKTSSACTNAPNDNKCWSEVALSTQPVQHGWIVLGEGSDPADPCGSIAKGASHVTNCGAVNCRILDEASKRQVASLPATGPLAFYSQPCASDPSDPQGSDTYKLDTSPLQLCDVTYVDLASKQTTPYSVCNALTNGNTHLQVPACWVYASTKGLEPAERSGWIMVAAGGNFLDGLCAPDPQEPPAPSPIVQFPAATCSEPPTDDKCQVCGYMQQTEAEAALKSAGIEWKTTGRRCSDYCRKSCTSLNSIARVVVDALLAFQKSLPPSCAPPLLTGGTEIGHALGEFSHSSGFKVDIDPTECITNYTKTTYKYTGLREDDKAPTWTSPEGHVFALEGDHWDVSFKKPAICSTCSSWDISQLSWDAFCEAAVASRAGCVCNEALRKHYDWLITQKKALQQGRITSYQELAMFLSQAFRETSCLQGSLEGGSEPKCCEKATEKNYKNGPPECDKHRPTNCYCGRGYLQITHCYKYHDFNVYLVDSKLTKKYSLPDVYETPKAVTDATTILPWESAFWQWKCLMRNSESVQMGYFGSSTCALNGGECGNGGLSENACAAVERFRNYRNMLAKLTTGQEKPPKAIADGCYGFVNAQCQSLLGDDTGLTSDAVKHTCIAARCVKPHDGGLCMTEDICSKVGGSVQTGCAPYCCPNVKLGKCCTGAALDPAKYYP